MAVAGIAPTLAALADLVVGVLVPMGRTLLLLVQRILAVVVAAADCRVVEPVETVAAASSL